MTSGNGSDRSFGLGMFGIDGLAAGTMSPGPWDMADIPMPPVLAGVTNLYGNGTMDGDAGDDVDGTIRETLSGMELYKASKALEKTGLGMASDTEVKGCKRVLEGISQVVIGLDRGMTRILDSNETMMTLLRTLVDETRETNSILRRGERMNGVTRHGGTISPILSIDTSKRLTDVFTSRKEMVLFYIILVYRCVINEIRTSNDGDDSSVYEVEAVTPQRARTSVTAAIDITMTSTGSDMPASSDASCAAFAQCLKPYTGPKGRHFTVDYFKYLEAAGTVRPVTVFIHAVWGRLKLCTTGLPSSLRQVIKRLAPPFVTEDGFLTCSLDSIIMETPSTADKEVAKLKVPALLTYYKARAGGSTHVTAMSKVYELNGGAKPKPLLTKIPKDRH